MLAKILDGQSMSISAITASFHAQIGVAAAAAESAPLLDASTLPSKTQVEKAIKEMATKVKLAGDVKKRWWVNAALRAGYSLGDATPPPQPVKSAKSSAASGSAHATGDAAKKPKKAKTLRSKTAYQLFTDFKRPQVKEEIGALMAAEATAAAATAATAPAAAPTAAPTTAAAAAAQGEAIPKERKDASGGGGLGKRMMVALAALWKAASAEERAPFVELANRDKLRVSKVRLALSEAAAPAVVRHHVLPSGEGAVASGGAAAPPPPPAAAAAAAAPSAVPSAPAALAAVPSAPTPITKWATAQPESLAASAAAAAPAAAVGPSSAKKQKTDAFAGFFKKAT